MEQPNTLHYHSNSHRKDSLEHFEEDSQCYYHDCS